MRIQGSRILLLAVFIAAVAAVSGRAWAFQSGSTGSDGAFAPASETVLEMPEDGIFNFTTVDVPSGVVVTFQKNTGNTPVYILASGDVNIAGTISVAGGAGGIIEAGEGGPGGYDGGMGGNVDREPGGRGLGPGGGGSGYKGSSSTSYSGGGGKYSSAYGNERLVPLVGGSGGGGGMGGYEGGGGGGGGGGGAIVIASSGAVNVTGYVYAHGGKGGQGSSTCGGSGSGGAIRLVASTVKGNGTLNAAGNKNCSARESRDPGWIRVEAEDLQASFSTYPNYYFGASSSVFVLDVPELRIIEVGGIPVPADAGGRFDAPDISMPEGSSGTVSVKVEGVNVPAGTQVNLLVKEEVGGKGMGYSGTLSGTDASSSATIDVTLSDNQRYVLLAYTPTFVLQTAMYLDGEKIEKVRVAATMDRGSRAVYITESGREVPAEEFLAALYRN
jgi:hypothetical protein